MKTKLTSAIVLAIAASVYAQSPPPGESNIVHTTQFCQNYDGSYSPVWRWTNSYPYFSGQGWCLDINGFVCNGPIGYLAFETYVGSGESSMKLVQSNYLWSAIGSGTFCYTNPVPPTGPELDDFFEIKAPTNVDSTAKLYYSYLLKTNLWHVTPNYNGQYYGSSVVHGESYGPNYWRSLGLTTNDPQWRIRYSQSGHYVGTNQSLNWQ